MVLPVSGPIAIQGHLPGSNPGSKSKRAIVIKLPDEIVQALITRRESSPNDPPLDIDFGENPVCTVFPNLGRHLTNRTLGYSHRYQLFLRRVCW